MRHHRLSDRDRLAKRDHKSFGVIGEQDEGRTCERDRVVPASVEYPLAKIRVRAIRLRAVPTGQRSLLCGFIMGQAFEV